MWSDSATKCLIVKDLDKKHEDTVDMTEELLKEHQVTGITKVLPLDQLKKEHKGKSFNAKFHFRWLESSIIEISKAASSPLIFNHLN